ncbi:hypothetical protein JCM15579A_06060 [Marinifilum fragile]
MVWLLEGPQPILYNSLIDSISVVVLFAANLINAMKGITFWVGIKKREAQ